MNLISLVYIIKDAVDFNARVKDIAKNLDSINYPKERFEAMFIINSFGSGKKLTESLPLIKIFYVRHINSEQYNCAMRNALGDLLVFVEGAHLFKPDDLKDVNGMVSNKTVWVTEKLVAVNKCRMITLPTDLFDLGTFLTLNLKGVNKQKFHRKEILRHAYKAENKRWLIWKYITGRN